jgi:N-acetylglucosaminyl-diphospho-decaprenol L-rhamnosyltransferase
MQNLVSQPVTNLIDLSIIIINWKSQAFVRQCLTSIFSNEGSLSYEILVVDNASFDGCEQMLKSEFPRVTFIQSEQNLGFARANNLAFSLSSGRYILFLNPDTEIQEAAIQKLISALESSSDAGMVGARLLNSDFSLQTTCIAAVPSILNQTLNSHHLREMFPRWKIWGMRALFGESREAVQVEAISGACMLGRREVIECVGGFNTDYFMYAEDMDLCVKVRKAGWNIYYVPDAKIVHHGGGSSSSHEESNFSNIMVRISLIRFFTLYRGPVYTTSYRTVMIFISVFRILVLIVASPIAIFTRGRRFISGAMSKWCCIFVWSLGIAEWMKLRPQPRQGVMKPTLKKLTEL